MGNGIAKPEDFRRELDGRVEPPVRVVLPTSGLTVKLRRPSPMWFLFHGHLPISLAARQSAAGEAPKGSRGALQSAEEFVEFSKWMVELLSEVFVGPKLSLRPGPEEISPEWLAEEDVNFIIRWAVGEVEAQVTGESGQGNECDSENSPRSPAGDLAEFRRTAS